MSIERLREFLAYEPNTGVFRWRVARGKASIGKVAGTITGANEKLYIQIQVDLVIYKAHRLAWFFVHGEWPTFDIDHRNGDGTDNRIDNLREATRLVNQQNIRRAHADSKVGYLGVARNGANFIARIMVNGKQRCLGTYESPEVAHSVYLQAKRKLHEGCTI